MKSFQVAGFAGSGKTAVVKQPITRFSSSSTFLFVIFVSFVVASLVCIFAKVVSLAAQ